MTLNTYLNRFRSVKHSNHCVMSWNACNILIALFPLLWVFWWNKHPRWKIKTPGNAISETLNFKMSLDALAFKNLCLWREFQSHPRNPSRFWKWPPSKITPPPPTPSQVINNQPLNQSILHDLIVRLTLYSRTSIQATTGLAAIKRQGLGISPGYYEFGPRLLS